MSGGCDALAAAGVFIARKAGDLAPAARELRGQLEAAQDVAHADGRAAHDRESDARAQMTFHVMGSCALMSRRAARPTTTSRNLDMSPMPGRNTSSISALTTVPAG